MVGTIGVAGSNARQQGSFLRWWERIAIPYALSAVAGGALLGLVVSFLGLLSSSLLGRVPPIALATAVLILAFGDAVGPPAKFLSRARQVPMSWKHVFPAPMSAALYGATLGMGLLSTAYFWSLHALLLIVFATADYRTAILAGAAFGAGRVVPVLASAFVTNEETLDRVAGRLYSSNWRLKLFSAISTGVAAVVVLGLT
jgi:hypothetical protein